MANGKKRDMQKDIQTLEDQLNIIDQGEMAGNKKNIKQFNPLLSTIHTVCCSLTRF